MNVLSLFDGMSCAQIALVFSAARRGCVDELRKDQKSNCLLAGGHQSRWLSSVGKLYRKLTPIECERLQTVPDNYTAHVSNTQRFDILSALKDGDSYS